MSSTESSATNSNPQPTISLLSLGLIFLHIGAVAFGGMWAAIDRIEKELVHKRGLVTEAEVRAMMITAALIPAPKFLAFGGMVGYQLRGYPGSVVSLVSLMAPGFSIVLAVSMFLGQGEEGTLLSSVQYTLTLGIVGLLLGNALKIALSAKVKPWQRALGAAIWAAIPLAVYLGNLSLLVMAVGGLIFGSLFIRPDRAKVEAANAAAEKASEAGEEEKAEPVKPAAKKDSDDA